MKALLLEDEHSLNANVKEFLELKGMDVESYLDGGELLEKCDLKSDIAILDIETPGATGYEVVEWIKRVNPKTPVIFMTAYTDIKSVKKGYALGCADYLKKPFNLEELWLRMRQLLGDANRTRIELGGDMEFDMRNERLYLGDEIAKLTKIQKKILKTLIANKNETVTYERLLGEVWNDVCVKENTIASHIKTLRVFLREGMIESVRSEGYRLNF